MLKGVMHVHSTYSDGEFTVQELRDTFLDAGCAFICMTDHAEYFDAARLKDYFDECRAFSDSRLRIVSGLEYSCDRETHILGYGASRLADSKDPQKVIAQIDAEGAISVIAHPKNEAFAWIETFSSLPQGIETWNSKYDGQRAPRPQTFALQQRLRQRKPELKAFYGLDLHWKHQFRGIYVEVNCEHNSADEILKALARGEYSATKDDLELPSSGVVPPQALADFARMRKRGESFRRLVKTAKKALDHCGIRVPDAVKSQLRRIL